LGQNQKFENQLRFWEPVTVRPISSSVLVLQTQL
jgi:hypothetical protein